MSKTESVSSQPAAAATEEKTAGETVTRDAPLLSLLPIPSLMVDRVDITFDMEVTPSWETRHSGDETDDPTGVAEPDWGSFAPDVNITGAVSGRKANTRSSDNPACYEPEA